MNELQNSGINELIEDCKSIITEGEFNYRWTLIETYHKLGVRILEVGSDKEILQQVAQGIGRSLRVVYLAIQFANKYPDINKLPDGKNISWHKLVNKYLPEHKKESLVCEHNFILKCSKCGKLK